MYPTAQSGGKPAGTPSERIAAVLRAVEAGPPPCACPKLDHRCRGDCDPDDYCACCLGECRCPPPRDHACCGDCDPDRGPCACCRGRCACPEMPWAALCRHGREWMAGVEATWPVLLLAADPGVFAERPAPTDVILTPDREARIELMAARVARREAVFARGQVDVAAFERLARLVHRGRNGSAHAGAVGTEEEVRHAG